MKSKEVESNKMPMNNRVPYIDMEKTGERLKRKIKEQGYMVKDIQEYLQLACPQAIYRWYKGQILPSVDNLLMLSRLLGVHMEDLLVIGACEKEGEPEESTERIVHCELYVWKEWKTNREGNRTAQKHLLAYWEKLYDAAVQPPLRRAFQ